MAAAIQSGDRGSAGVSEVAEKARGIILTGLTDLPTSREHVDFAGYVLFSRNGASVTELRFFSDMLRAECLGPPPIIAIDQEGGRVVRLHEGVEIIPSMMAVGAAGDLELAERAGEQTAFDLRRAGCTMDFAPVLDLALDSRNTVIGTRSFGADPQSVAAFGLAFAGASNAEASRRVTNTFPVTARRPSIRTTRCRCSMPARRCCSPEMSLHLLPSPRKRARS